MKREEQMIYVTCFPKITEQFGSRTKIKPSFLDSTTLKSFPLSTKMLLLSASVCMSAGQVTTVGILTLSSLLAASLVWVTSLLPFQGLDEWNSGAPDNNSSSNKELQARAQESSVLLS